MPPMQQGSQNMGAGQDCEQILDPNFCKGPAMDGPGFICSWQGNECDAINPSSPKGQCKMLSNDEAACTLQHGCHWDPKEFECEFGDQPLSHENQYAPQVPATGQLAPAAPEAHYAPPVAPAAPAPAQGMAPAPVAPAAPAHGHGMPPAPPGAHHGAPAVRPPPPPAAPVVPQDCRRLMEPQCFGPSLKRGEVCMYDAEDFECRSRLSTDVEAVC